MKSFATQVVLLRKRFLDSIIDHLSFRKWKVSGMVMSGEGRGAFGRIDNKREEIWASLAGINERVSG